MEKMYLDTTSSKALKALTKELNITDETPTNGTFAGNLQISQEFTQSAQDMLENLESTIFDSITEIYNRNHCKSIEVLSNIFENISKIKQQIESIEEYATRAVIAIDQITEKSMLTWYASDEQILNEFTDTDLETNRLCIELRGEKIYLIFETESEKTEEVAKREILIAYGSKKDIAEVEQHLQCILNENH